MEYNKLDQDYSYEVDTPGKEEWADIVVQFQDASLYQTWAYGKIHWGENCLSHLILKKKNELIAATQVRIVKVPVFGNFIAYIYKGPMWKKKDTAESVELLCQMLRAIIHEYVQKRKLFVKIVPHEYQYSNNRIDHCYLNEGFSKDASAYKRKTYLLDITSPMDTLHKGLSKKWRENLRRSRRGLLEVSEGTSTDLYDLFLELYKVMHTRKQFISYVDVYEFKRIQEQLRQDQKLHILVCKHNEIPVASLVWSSVGNTGVPIFSATGNDGRKLRGSYLLRWIMLERLKEQNKQYIDQGGVNVIRNPGGYQFKKGMGGEEIEYIGEFDICGDLIKRIIIKAAFMLRKIIRDIKFMKYIKKSGKNKSEEKGRVK